MDQKLRIAVEVAGAQTAEQQLGGVAKSTDQVGTSSQEASKKTSGLTSTMKNLATGFAVYKGAQFIKGAVTATTDLAKATAGLQRITGMDAGTSAAWVAMAKERGVESKALNMGFISLAKNMTAAAGGSKSTQAAFAALGLDAAGLKAQDTSTQLGMLADSFKALPAGADKAALASKLFGRQAQTMLPLLNKGAQGLNAEVGAMAKHTNMSQASLKEQLALVKSQREMNATMMQMKVAVGTALIPILQTLMQLLTPLIQAFASLMQRSSGFRVAIVSVTAALITFVAAAKLVALAGLEVNAAWLLIPAAIVGVGLALVMLYKKCGWFRDAVQAIMHAIVAAFNWIKNAALAVWGWIKDHWPLLLAILGGPFALLVGEVIKHFDKVKDIVSGVFDWIKTAISDVASVVGKVLGGGFKIVSDAIHVVVSGINDIISAAQKIGSLPGKVLGAITGGASDAAGFLTGGLIGGGQTGLYASHAGAALVGEHGPEMVTLPQGAQVHPFKSGGGSGGGGNIVVPVYLDRHQIALAMGSYTADQQAAR